MSNIVQPDIPETLAIEDDKGRAYALRIYDEEGTWVLKVFDGRVLVAQVNCLAQGDVLLLGEIHVFDQARLPQGMLTNWLRSALGLKPRTGNYQGRGLGTRLLRLIIERAQRGKFSRIVGKPLPARSERETRPASLVHAPWF